MRVITGKCRGRRLQEPVGMDVRPTTDQVKEAMFNIIQFDIEGRKVLDLFAGTGQLGIEALSRGAAECVFVDSARDSVRLVQENLRRCGLTARVLQCDSLGILKSGEKFDVIFLDPPYGTGLDSKAILAIKEFDILSRGGIMICETRPETVLPELPAEYGTTRVYRYGKIKLTVITRGNDECKQPSAPAALTR